ncbi:MAG TPA: YwiC-like family protein, partial [Pyrinomonadaceae bacterium]|nr:YwiC-like family protein [Pyrinomonadaceae bacterium]
MTVRAVLKMPREHGAWVMLYVPLIAGVLVAWNFSFRVLLFGLSATFLFIARESLLTWWRAYRRGEHRVEALLRLGIYLSLAALSIGPLILADRLYALVPLGLVALLLLAVNAEMAAKREDRTIVGEILAIAGLTMTAPAANYVAEGTWQDTAIWLWFLSALYFASSVFYIKLRVNLVNPRKQEARKSVWRRCASYHALLFVSLFLLATTDQLNHFALVAFAPAITRASWSLVKTGGRLDLKRLGLLEI